MAKKIKKLIEKSFRKYQDPASLEKLQKSLKKKKDKKKRTTEEIQTELNDPPLSLYGKNETDRKKQRSTESPRSKKFIDQLKSEEYLKGGLYGDWFKKKKGK